MRQRSLGRRGQNTVEYLMMVSVVVGVVLIGGAALKRFMPSLFGGVQDMIAGAASGDESSGDSSGAGGMGSSKSGSSNKPGAASSSGDDGSVASAGADGATSTDDPGHGHAKGATHPHTP